MLRILQLRRFGLLWLCLSALFQAPAEARVFLRWGAGRHAARTLEALGGKSAYESAITLNGGKGDLRVYTFTRSPRDVAQALEKAFGVSGLSSGEDSMALATVRSRGMVLRLIVVQLPGRDITLVFAVEQSEEEFARSSSPPDDASIGTIPAYPGSRALFRAEDLGSQTALVVSEARAPAADVRAFYRSRLKAEGWEPALPPPNGPGAEPPLGVYLRSGQICCVLAEEKGFRGETRATILYKTEAIE